MEDTRDGEPTAANGEPVVPRKLVALSRLVAVEAVAFAVFGVAVVASALGGGANAGAVAFDVFNAVVFGAGMALCAWGLRRRRRWAFTPVVLVQVLFGLVFVSILRGEENPPQVLVVVGTLMVLNVAILVLAFSREVRGAIIRPTTTL